MGDLIYEAWKHLAFYKDSDDLEHLAGAVEKLAEWAELKELETDSDDVE